MLKRTGWILLLVAVLGLWGCADAESEQTVSTEATEDTVTTEEPDTREEGIVPEQENEDGEAADTEDDGVVLPDTPYNIDREGGYVVKIDEITIESENGDIFAVIYRPKELETPRPALIFSHGYGDSSRGGQQYALALAKQGYLVCCFDFRGGGMMGKSEGSALEMTIFTEQADLEAVLAAVQVREDVDPDHIYLQGNSQGGLVSAITAAEHAAEIAGMVLLSPALSMSDDTRAIFESKEAIPDSYYHMIMEVGRPYFAEIYDYDVYEDMKGYEGDVLILHGDRDSLVPISYSERALEVLPAAELHVLEGEEHMYSAQAIQEAIDLLGEFLYEHISE